MRNLLVRAAAPVLALVAGLGVMTAATPAQAWWHHGGYGGGYGGYYGPRVFFGPGVVIGPPVVFGPPVVYGPPVIYSPAPALAGQGCYAGAYVCPLDQPTPVGGGCSCPVAGNTRVYGSAR